MHRFTDILGLGEDEPEPQGSFPGGSALRRRITVLEGRPLFRDMIAYALRHASPDMQVEAVSALSDVHPERHQVILFNFVGRSCDREIVEALLYRLRTAFPRLPVVLVLEHMPEGVPEVIERLGVSGWTAGRQGLAALVGVVRRAMASGEVAIMRDTPGAGSSAPRVALPDVSSRERDILTLVQQGKPNKLIAHELGISESTVKVHLRNLMCKLHVHNRTQLALTGYRAAEPNTNEHRPLPLEQMAAAVPVFDPIA